MIAGLILKESTKKSSKIAFIDKKLECFSIDTNEEIVELIEKKEPELIAVNVSSENPTGGLTDKEKSLKEEGYQFTPSSHQTVERRRLEALKNHLFESLGQDKPEFIRFDPFISMEALALHDDDAFRSYGVNPSDIKNSGEFEAAVGAITARFFESNQFEDKGVIIPESLDSEDDRND